MKEGLEVMREAEGGGGAQMENTGSEGGMGGERAQNLYYILL